MIRTVLLTVSVLFVFGFAGTAAAQEEQVDLEFQALNDLDLEQIHELLDKSWKKYETQLQSVLRTRLTEEKEFVGQVTLLVQREKLPKKLVDSAWLWVRKKRPTTSYPFIYFERVLRLQAERAKLRIPEFDRNIYSELPASRRR